MKSLSTERIQLSVIQLRWLQEMGVSPAALRAYAPPRRVNSPAPQPAGSGRSLFLQQLQKGAAEPATKQANSLSTEAALPTAPMASTDTASVSSMASLPLAAASEQAPPSISAVPADVQAVQAGTQFDSWRESLMDCRSCPRSEHRLRVLSGVGQTQQPQWFVLGGVPNRQDERMGQAWQSSAGRLLEAQLRSLGLDPEQDVYCSYALKCRADEAQPSEESIAACRQVFLAELQIIAPKYLLLLGSVAVQMVFGQQAQWQQLRGQVQRWQMPDGPEFAVVVSQEPAALLLRPQQKARAWRDLLVAQQLMATA